MELHQAVIEHDINGVKSAISSPFIHQNVKNISIILAAYVNDVEIVKLLLDNAISPTIWDLPLNYQRKWESKDIKLQHAKIDSDLSPFSGGWTPRMTPACLAAFYGHIEVLRVLINARVDLNHDPYLYKYTGMRDVNCTVSSSAIPSWNALTCALFGKQWKIANMLVDEGLRPTSMKGQEKAWQFVLRNRAMDMARVLLCQNHRHLPPEMIREIADFL